MQNMTFAEVENWLKNQTAIKHKYHPVIASTGIKVITSNWNQSEQAVAGNTDVNTRLDYIRDLGYKIFEELKKENDVVISPDKFKEQFNARYIPNNSITPIIKRKEIDPVLLPDDLTVADVVKQRKEADQKLKVGRILNTKFTVYWENKIDHWIKTKRISMDSRKNYISSVNHWKEFEVELFNKKEFIVAEIDDDLIEEFAIYVTNKESKRKKYKEEFLGMRLGTVSKHKTRVKTILIELKVGDKVNLEIETGVKVLSKKTEKTEDVALTEIELQKIYKADFSKIENPEKYKSDSGFSQYKDELEFYRNCFLLGILSGGCRVSDLKQLKDIRPIGGGKFKLVYKSEKTNFDVDIQLPDFFLVVFKKVKDKLNLLDEIKYNKNLRLIGLIAGLTDIVYLHITDPATGKVHPKLNKPIYALLSSHTARRTFITLMYEKRMSPIDILELTGIKNIGTLENYIKKKRRTIQAEEIAFE